MPLAEVIFYIHNLEKFFTFRQLHSKELNSIYCNSKIIKYMLHKICILQFGPVSFYIRKDIKMSIFLLFFIITIKMIEFFCLSHAE